jgi:hypothetical protein
MATHDEGTPGREEILRETQDSIGDRVVLLSRVWHGKIAVDHPEMASFIEEVLRAAHVPDHAESDPVHRDRTRYYSRGVGPSAWLVVVVSYEQKPARIVSAFANRKDPPAWSA